MRNNYFIYIGIVSFLMLIGSCKSDSQHKAVSKDKISLNLYIRYLKDAGQFLAHADFFEEDSLVADGTPIELAGTVSVQNNPMRLRNLPNNIIRYQYQNQEGVQAAYTFAFTTPDGSEQRYTAEMPIVNDFSIKAGIRKSTGLVLVLDKALAEGEELLALFVNAENRITPVTIEGPTQSNEIPLTAGAIRDLTLGDGNLYLLKKKLQTINEESYQGIALTEFYTRQIPITVEE